MLVPETLQNLLLQRQCVAFVGAGFSMVCGMPGWKGLLLRLYEEARASVTDESHESVIRRVEDALNRDELLLAVSLIRQILPVIGLNRAISRQYDMAAFHDAPADQQARMLERLDNLVNGPWSGIITTNYDSLIELGLGRFTRGNFIESSAMDENFGAILCGQSSRQRFFVKMHGSVSGGGYVLGTEEYDRMYLANPRVAAFLTATALRYHLVFIGCSLEDEILRSRRQICHDFNGNIPTAYALLPKNSINSARRQWLVDHAQITPLLYEPEDDDGSHFVVDRFLSQTREDMDPSDDSEIGKEPDSLQVGLRKLPLQKRINQIGVKNRSLLTFVFEASGKNGVTHGDMVEPTNITSVRNSVRIQNMSPDERIYRTLFLVSIQLLEESSSPAGETIYQVCPDVAEFLQP